MSPPVFCPSDPNGEVPFPSPIVTRPPFLSHPSGFHTIPVAVLHALTGRSQPAGFWPFAQAHALIGLVWTQTFCINNARRRRHRAAVQTQKGRNLARETPAHTASRAARRVETARRGQPRSYADGRERSTRVAGGYLGGTGGGRANGKDDGSEIHKRGRQCNSRGQRERKLQNVAQVQITSKNNNRGKNHNHNQSCSREGRQRRGRGS